MAVDNQPISKRRLAWNMKVASHRSDNQLFEAMSQKVSSMNVLDLTVQFLTVILHKIFGTSTTIEMSYICACDREVYVDGALIMKQEMMDELRDNERQRNRKRWVKGTINQLSVGTICTW
jgi:predicted lipid carrier protein YhbT